MKIYVTGVSGLIGHNFAKSAVRRGHQVTGIYSSNAPLVPGLFETIKADLADVDALTPSILDSWPDVIVNAAAVSSPRDVDDNPKVAEKLNVALPRRLAQLSTHIGARFVQLSTDMVFDGIDGAPYRSTDLPHPSNLYGQMKLLAEREVLEHNPEDPVVLRITLVMGNSPGGRRSVHERLLEAISRGERPSLFTDEMRQPCSAENVAEVLVELSERRDLHGIFHWAGGDPVTRYELGRQILRHFQLPEDSIEPARLADNPGFANRPADLRMILHPLEGKLKTRPASIEEQIEELVVPDFLFDWHRKNRIPRGC